MMQLHRAHEKRTAGAGRRRFSPFRTYQVSAVFTHHAQVEIWCHHMATTPATAHGLRLHIYECGHKTSQHPPSITYSICYDTPQPLWRLGQKRHGTEAPAHATTAMQRHASAHRTLGAPHEAAARSCPPPACTRPNTRPP